MSAAVISILPWFEPLLESVPCQPMAYGGGRKYFIAMLQGRVPDYEFKEPSDRDAFMEIRCFRNQPEASLWIAQDIARREALLGDVHP